MDLPFIAKNRKEVSCPWNHAYLVIFSKILFFLFGTCLSYVSASKFHHEDVLHLIPTRPHPQWLNTLRTLGTLGPHFWIFSSRAQMRAPWWCQRRDTLLENQPSIPNIVWSQRNLTSTAIYLCKAPCIVRSYQFWSWDLYFMKLIKSEHVGHIMRLLPSKMMLPDLEPLRVSIWCTTCDHALKR